MWVLAAGAHTKGLAFEGLANGKLVCGYKPADPGPTLSNLRGGSRMSFVGTAAPKLDKSP